MAGSIASSIVSLLVIFGLLIAATIMLRRLRHTQWGQRASHSPIQITTTRPLGGQNALIIAEVEGQRFLIGLSRAGMTSIGRLGGE